MYRINWYLLLEVFLSVWIVCSNWFFITRLLNFDETFEAPAPVSINVAYTRRYYWLTRIHWLYVLISQHIQARVLGFDSRFLGSCSFIWNTFSRLYFWCFSELCIVLGLRSVHLCNDSSNLGKSHSCHSSSSLTSSALILGNLSRVSLMHYLISISLCIVSRAFTLTTNFS